MEDENAVFGGYGEDATLTARKWSIADWLGNEATWSSLLARSNADALFLSWDWLTLWWQCFAGTLSAVPEILAFYSGSDLIGIVPLYRRRVVRSGLLPTTSVQLIGMSWRDAGAPISEYLDVIAIAAETDRVRSACARILLN